MERAGMEYAGTERRAVPRAPTGAAAGLDALLLDLDGTCFVGAAAVPGAAEALGRLRAAALPFRFVTNTSSRSRAKVAEKLRGLGLDVAPSEITNAPHAAAALARARGHRVVAPFVAPAAHEDLDGLLLAGGLAPQPVPAGARVDAVIVGDLGEAWTYALMQEAFGHLMTGAELIACSRDRYFRRGDALVLDAGPFIAGLEYATGRAAAVAGKPSAAFYHGALRALGLDPAAAGLRAAMVGDDVWSDVQGAQRAGLQGWLVRTGKFRESVLRESGVVPDRVLASVAEL